jgi:SAM-dependent methyltransferase
MANKHQSTTRFSNRVADYVQFRPHYPLEIIDLLGDKCELTPESVIADIGSGTGLLAKIFLENGNPVIGIEPNLEMRLAGEQYLAEFGRFTSMDGTAEATRLPAHAIDIAVSGQAFHWFDPAKARAEFIRILKPEGFAVLVWNVRRADTTPFLREYEKLVVKFGTDYQEVNHEHAQKKSVLRQFFGGEFYELLFDNLQRLNLDGLLGRIHSSSYMPVADDANYALMVKQAKEIFAAHQQSGVVTFEYDTAVYYGMML